MRCFSPVVIANPLQIWQCFQTKYFNRPLILWSCKKCVKYISPYIELPTSISSKKAFTASVLYFIQSFLIFPLNWQPPQVMVSAFACKLSISLYFIQNFLLIRIFDGKRLITPTSSQKLHPHKTNKSFFHANHADRMAISSCCCCFLCAHKFTSNLLKPTSINPHNCSSCIDLCSISLTIHFQLYCHLIFAV